MSSDRLPTILIIPGAFHRTSSFDTFLPHLQALGFTVIVAAYPSLNPSDPIGATLAADVASIRDEYLQPLIDNQDKEVLLLLHSYGGVVGGGAATGFSKSERLSQGKAGGIIGLVYITGNIVSEGESTIEALGGAYPRVLKINTVCTHLGTVFKYIHRRYTCSLLFTTAIYWSSLGRRCDTTFLC